MGRGMERWIESGQEVLSGLAEGFVVRMCRSGPWIEMKTVEGTGWEW